MPGLQISLFGARTHATRPLRGHPRAAALVRRVETCLQLFPELDEQQITIGVTRAADGIAVLDDMTVRFDIRRRLPTYYTVGHELTHLVQALGQVPGGEIQCDIWTLARHPMFLDEEPCYLPVPDALRKEWHRVAETVAGLCREAIARRPRHRTYIRWLRREIEGLRGGPAP